MSENAVIKNSEGEGGGDKESEEIESPLLCAWMEYNGWDVVQWEGLWVILPNSESTNSCCRLDQNIVKLTFANFGMKPFFCYYSKV